MTDTVAEQWWSFYTHQAKNYLSFKLTLILLRVIPHKVINILTKPKPAVMTMRGIFYWVCVFQCNSHVMKQEETKKKLNGKTTQAIMLNEFYNKKKVPLNLSSYFLRFVVTNEHINIIFVYTKHQRPKQRKKCDCFCLI